MAVTFKPEPGVRYDMPVVFGPSEMPRTTTYGEKHTIIHTFLTEPDAVEPLIPYHFDLAEPAKVSVIARMHRGVDWLAWRNYNSVRISVDVVARHGDEVLRGPYGLVVWESDPRPAIVGREYLGTSKICGEIPDHVYEGDRASFECLEYGTPLLQVDVEDIRAEDADAVAARNERPESVTLCWKYIPGPGGTVDADYPIKMVSRGTIDSLSTGRSTLTWGETTWEQCPISHRIVDTLATLPVVEVLPATLTVAAGSVLDRGASARLA
jgi:acetoacetate decarboxylase